MFKGLGNLGNIASLMGAFQELPAKMQELNAEMEQTHVSGSSSCGRVTVVVNCVGKVQSVEITEAELEVAILQTAVQDATNSAGALAKQTYATAMKEMAASMNLDLPGVDGLLTSLTGH